jgi:cation transport ATPase
VQQRSDLGTLSENDRRQLARWLAELNRPTTGGADARRQRRAVLAVTTTAAILLVPWTLLLAVHLPEQHQAQYWRLTWVGLDIALVLAFAASAWLGWRRRHAVMTALVCAATLVLCDAWFDVTLSWGGRGQVSSLVAAVGIEVPLAVLLLLVYHRLNRAFVAQAWTDRGYPGTPPALYRTPLLLREAGAEPPEPADPIN